MMIQLKEQTSVFREIEGQRQLVKNASQESVGQPARKLNTTRSQSLLHKSAICLRSDSSKSPDRTSSRTRNSAANKSFGDLRSVQLNLRDLQELASN